VIALLAALACVAANAFFVAAEFAFAKVRPTALEALARTGDVRAARALRMTRRLDAYLSATQLGITLASLGLGWLGEPALASFLAPPLRLLGASETVVHGIALTTAFAVISLLHIVVGELVPKSAAIQNPETISRWSGGPLRVFFLLTWPAMWVLNGLSNLILRLLRLPPPQHGDGSLSAEEIRIIIHASFRDADLQDRKRDLLERVLRGTDRSVRAIMVPRVDMVTADLEGDVDSCLVLARDHGFSRYPLCDEGDPDRVRGYVHVKDVLTAAAESTRKLSSIKRDVLFVPESAKVGDVLSEFQLTSIPIAIVVDEYGGTAGMVTLEDLLEELVGEINDEFDEDADPIAELGGGRVLVDGTMNVGHLNEELGTRLPEEGWDSLGGLVFGTLGRVPEQGDTVEVAGVEMVVDELEGRRIAKVALTIGDDLPHPRRAPDVTVT
jgi:CBS domain containing-hemolysin-like protein